MDGTLKSQFIWFHELKKELINQSEFIRKNYKNELRVVGERNEVHLFEGLEQIADMLNLEVKTEEWDCDSASEYKFKKWFMFEGIIYFQLFEEAGESI